MDMESDEADSTLEQILKLDPDHIYVDVNHQKSDITEKGVNLIYRAAFGRERLKELTSRSIHINYDQLPLQMSVLL